ncbi:hypothetical protein ZTR_06007 [Talaromyces verruculosus]|nr:hypothetical protein ZTR_06007 [Talaromyces verruculosus]
MVKVLEARLGKALLLKNVVNAIRELVQECIFIGDDSGIALQTMDDSRFTLISMILRSEVFASFQCDRNVDFGIDLNCLVKLLQCAGDDDTLTLKAEDDSDTVNLTFGNPEDNCVTVCEIQCKDIDPENVGMPEIDYDAVITMPSSKLKQICNNLFQLSAIVAIECTKEGVKFSSIGDVGSAKVTLPPSDNGKVEIDLTKPVTLNFSLKYLVAICKSHEISSQVRLSLSTEQPLLLEYSLGNNSFLRFYLAPNI